MFFFPRMSKTKIYHPNPQMLNLTAWLLSTEVSTQRDFLSQLEICSLHLGEKVHKEIILRNSKSAIGGVVENRLIHIQQI
jgi:hypothetical protein